MIRRLDHWIGSRVFQPPIIWLCQRSGMTQYAVSRYAWMLATWTLVMRISFAGVGNWLLSVLILLMTLIETYRAAMTPNLPIPRNDGLRCIILIFALVGLARVVIVSAQSGFPGFNLSHCWDLFALVAEYAKTIDTIPPREVAGARGPRASRTS